MSITTFEGAKIDDKLYCGIFPTSKRDDKTNCYVYQVRSGEKFPLQLKNENGWLLVFTIKGQLYPGGGQVVFWSKPEFVIPAKLQKTNENHVPKL